MDSIGYMYVAGMHGYACIALYTCMFMFIYTCMHAYLNGHGFVHHCVRALYVEFCNTRQTPVAIVNVLPQSNVYTGQIIRP